MRITFKYSLGDHVIDKATKITGRIVIVGADDIGVCYEVQFARAISSGRKRQWKRESEIEPMLPAPKKRKKKKRSSL